MLNLKLTVTRWALASYVSLHLSLAVPVNRGPDSDTVTVSLRLQCSDAVIVTPGLVSDPGRRRPPGQRPGPPQPANLTRTSWPGATNAATH